MKVSKKQLKRIIRVEKAKVLKEMARKKKLNETIQRKLKEYYHDDDDDGGDTGNNEARMADHDPIRIQVPAYEEAFPDELEDSPEGKAFDYGFAIKIAEVLEEDEPNYEDSMYDYDDADGGDTGNNDAHMADFDPIQIQVPAYEEAFPEELQDSPEGKAFEGSFANQIAEVLEQDEPNIERYDYDDQDEDYIVAKKIWDVAEEAGLDNGTLASSIRAAYEEANEAGYNY